MSDHNLLLKPHHHTCCFRYQAIASLAQHCHFSMVWTWRILICFSWNFFYSNYHTNPAQLSKRTRSGDVTRTRTLCRTRFKAVTEFSNLLIVHYSSIFDNNWLMWKDISETISIHSVSTNSDESHNRLVSGEKVVSTTITDRSITAGCEAHRLSLWTEKNYFLPFFYPLFTTLSCPEG